MNTPVSFIDPVSLAASARLRVVLVGTQHPGNIGAAARALKTMGLARLVLVAPENYPAEEAYRRAAGADDLLADAAVVATLAEAVADCQLVLGCTARSRRVQLEEHAPRQAAALAVGRAAAGGEVALVFGRERTGLSNEELQLCHAAVHIPANPEYSSLNLAAAVQVLAYELRMALLDGAPATAASPAHPDDVPASHAHMEGFFAQLADTLDAIDFHKGRTPDSAMRKLRRLFAKADLNEQEVRLLRGILADAQRMARLAGAGGSGSLS
ncbi:tRNA (cytidine32/uridine32-2'-O)-methyltransferase [Pseudoxanthomonas sp. 3HH-4]|uniref:RNA methyltransferase n=1 Tax=Pseudoxanthomonas sp. 3HH-4 TaxID=1690214 RepID=UPI00115257D5|nr:RNA methyltransferase [Pseudoxanthomonas sp. 3HH-4]TQM17773.1 tRNA (cytidine32/uridine32-2'-O)-methyltransferase [Pseudoxanthomonas sp. 3HH-4]